jgi:hypothetical protein
MDDPVLARLLDAALPFVAGRRINAIGLPAEAAAALTPWNDPKGAPCTLVLAQSSERIQKALEAAAGITVLLLPGLRAPELPGLSVIDVQYAFEDETGVADERAPATLGNELGWPFGRVAGTVHLDVERPGKPLGCIVIARVS